MLLVVPDGGVSAETAVLGIPLRRRIALAAARAGFARVLDARDAPGAVSRGRFRIVLLPASVVPQPRWLASLLAMAVEADTLYVDPSLALTVETDDPGPILAAAAGAADPRAVLARLGARLPTVERSLDPDGRRVLAGPADVASAEHWLLRSLIKRNEGFMSRHVERRISLAITRRLVGTRVTPNAMTLVSLAAGLAGAACFVSPTAAWQLTGALLFLSHSILDGCDGELARLRFQESKWGAILDFWGDNIVHLAFFMGVATGWSREVHAAWPLVLGAVAGLAGLGAAVRLAGRTMRDEAPDAGASWASRLEASLASRDFIYAVVALSAFGKAKWFLAVAAIGVPVFLLLSLSTTRASRGG